MNRRALPIIAGALLVGVLIDIPLHSTRFPGYAALIGLFGCIALIVVAKQLLSPLVDRPEDYYGDEVPPDVQHDVWAVRADDPHSPRGSDSNDRDRGEQRPDTPAPGEDAGGAT